MRMPRTTRRVVLLVAVSLAYSDARKVEDTPQSQGRGEFSARKAHARSSDKAQDAFVVSRDAEPERGKLIRSLYTSRTTESLTASRTGVLPAGSTRCDGLSLSTNSSSANTNKTCNRHLLSKLYSYHGVKPLWWFMPVPAITTTYRMGWVTPSADNISRGLQKHEYELCETWHSFDHIMVINSRDWRT